MPEAHSLTTIHSYTVLLPPTSSSIQSTASSTSPTQNIVSATSASDTSSSSNHVLPIALGTVLGSLGLLVIAVLLWFFCKGRKRPKSEAWTIAGGSPKKESPPTGPLSPHQPPTHPMYPSHQPMYPSYQQPYNAGLNPSWSGPTPQMSTANSPLATNPHHNAYMNSNPPMQDFNPYIGFVPPPIPPHQDPYAQQQTFSSHYAPTTLSTITERSTPGTLGSSRTPLAASPASFPSADLSYYTPPQDPGHAARLSHNGDIPMGTPAAAYQHPHMFPSGSSGQLRSPGSSSSVGGSGSGGKPGKLGKEKNSMVAVNRTQDEEDGSGPPAYTPR